VPRKATSEPTRPSPLVRLARPEEADLLIDFQTELAHETEGVQLDRGVLGGGVRAVFDDPSQGEYWVAELDGEVAGGLLLTREWSDWRNGTILWVQSVFVRPELRGRGVYSALHAHVRRRVEASPDLKGIRLYVDRANLAAQQAYERLGMTAEHYVLYEWMKKEG
jgi:GNAT superfamily N-acetyltransferase